MASSDRDVSADKSSVISENPKGSFIILDVAALILAIFFNVGLIAAVKKVALRIKGYRVFLINLAVANIFIASVSLLMYGTEYLSHYLQSKFVERCVGSVLRSLSIASILCSILSLCGMSMDHYYGIVKPFRYASIFGKTSRLLMFVAMIWIMSLFICVAHGFGSFIKYYARKSTFESEDKLKTVEVHSPKNDSVGNENVFLEHFLELLTHDNETLDAFLDADSNEIAAEVATAQSETHSIAFCRFYADEMVWLEVLTISVVAIVFALQAPFYSQVIYQVQNVGFPVRKLVHTTIFLYGTFALCRLPFVLFESTMLVAIRFGFISPLQHEAFKASLFINHFLNSLHLFYPLLDPIIYTLRMKTVRRFFISKICKKSINNDELLNGPNGGNVVDRRLSYRIKKTSSFQQEPESPKFLSSNNDNQANDNNTSLQVPALHF